MSAATHSAWGGSGGTAPAHLGVALGTREGRAPLPNPCAPRLSSPAPTRGGRCWRLNSTCSFWSFPTAPPPCSRTLLAARSLWVIFWRIWRGPRPPTLGRWQFPRGSPPEWSFPRQRPLSEGSPEFGISLPPSGILGIRTETDYPESSSLLSPKLSPRRNLSRNCLSLAARQTTSIRAETFLLRRRFGEEGRKVTIPQPRARNFYICFLNYLNWRRRALAPSHLPLVARD